MSHSANNKACCFPYLSFKKQANRVQVSVQNKSALGLSNSQNKETQLTKHYDNQSLKKVKKAELLQSVGGVHDKIKSNKVVPQINIIVNDSPSFHDQSAITSAMSKGQYSESPSPCNFASQGFSAMLGFPSKKLDNYKYIQNNEEDNLKIKADNDSIIEQKYINIVTNKNKVIKQSPFSSQLLQNQQDIKSRDKKMEIISLTHQNNLKSQIIENLPKQNIYQQKHNQLEQKNQFNRHFANIQQSISQGHTQLEDIGQDKQDFQKISNLQSHCRTRKIQKIPICQVNGSMIQQENDQFINNILMDFNLTNFKNNEKIIDSSHLDEELVTIEVEVDLDDSLLQIKDEQNSSSSSSYIIQQSISSNKSSSYCSDSSKSISNSSNDSSIHNSQNLREGKINLKNHPKYSIFMKDQSESRDFPNESSICRFGSGNYQDFFQYNKNITEGQIKYSAKPPQMVSPQISQRHVKGDADQVIQRSPILQEKFSFSNQQVKLEGQNCLQIGKNISIQQISESCVKLPYFQTQGGKQNFINFQSSKRSTEVSHLNQSLVYEDLININEDELLRESVSSLDMEEELY